MNDPGFGLSVKSFPVKRSSYAVLSLFLVENFQMSTSELEFAENTLFVEDFDLLQEPKHSYWPRIRTQRKNSP